MEYRYTPRVNASGSRRNASQQPVLVVLRVESGQPNGPTLRADRGALSSCLRCTTDMGLPGTSLGMIRALGGPLRIRNNVLAGGNRKNILRKLIFIIYKIYIYISNFSKIGT